MISPAKEPRVCVCVCVYVHMRVHLPVDAKVFQAEDHLEKTLQREEELKGSGCWRRVELIILECPTSM